MSTKKTIVISSILAILFFIVGLNLAPLLMTGIVGYLIGEGQKQVLFINTSLTQRFQIHLFSAISFALVPVFVMLLAIFIKKLKNRTITTWDYFFHFSIILSAFLFGCYCKFYVIKFSIQDAVNHPANTDMVHSIPVANIKLYDWGFFASLLATAIVLLVVKKRKRA